MHLERWHEVETFRVRQVAERRVFADVADCIDTETVNPLVEPPVDHVVHRLAHLGVLPVQVRLFLREDVQEVLFRRLVKLPSRPAKN